MARRRWGIRKENRQIIGIDEFVDHYAPPGMTKRVAWGRCRNGQIPGAFKMGRRWYVNIAEWLESGGER